MENLKRKHHYGVGHLLSRAPDETPPPGQHLRAPPSDMIWDVMCCDLRLEEGRPQPPAQNRSPPLRPRSEGAETTPVTAPNPALGLRLSSPKEISTDGDGNKHAPSAGPDCAARLIKSITSAAWQDYFWK